MSGRHTRSPGGQVTRAPAGSRTVYLVRGGPAPPISRDDWRQAALETPELDLQPVAADGALAAHLRGHPKQVLKWRSGHLYTRNPDARMAAVMFQVASRLQAGIVSESGHAYPTLIDWQRSERRHTRQRARQRSRRNTQLSGLVALLVGIVMLVTLLVVAALR